MSDASRGAATRPPIEAIVSSTFVDESKFDLVSLPPAMLLLHTNGVKRQTWPLNPSDYRQCSLRAARPGSPPLEVVTDSRLVGVKDVATLRLSLPASLLEPIPNLEYWQYADRADVFAA